MTEDLFIVGAGVAGAFAAARLTQAGQRVRVLEARGRVGGRAFARPFADGGEGLEFGGAWITPWHHRLRAAADRLRLGWRPRTPVLERRWLRDGSLHRDGPAGPAEETAHRRAMAQVTADALARKAGRSLDAAGRSLTDISFAAYLERLAAPPATRDLLAAWWCVSGNGAWDRVPASELLASCAYHDGTPDGMIAVWDSSVALGMDRLVAGLLDAPGVALETGTAVSRVAHDAEGVTLELADGRQLRGQAAVLATGLNPLRHLAFDPPLPPAQRRAAGRGHEGRALKLWAEVEGVLQPGVLATGRGGGLDWMLSERISRRETTLLVGFGLASDAFDPTDAAAVAAVVGRFFPEARLLAFDHHDWAADPWSLGTWVATPIDAPETVAAETWRPLGRLAFASSDIAAESAGWFEGAAASGEAAAAAVLAALA